MSEKTDGIVKKQAYVEAAEGEMTMHVSDLIEILTGLPEDAEVVVFRPVYDMERQVIRYDAELNEVVIG